MTDGAGMDWRRSTSTILVLVEKKVLPRSRAVGLLRSLMCLQPAWGVRLHFGFEVVRDGASGVLVPTFPKVLGLRSPSSLSFLA